MSEKKPSKQDKINKLTFTIDEKLNSSLNIKNGLGQKYFDALSTNLDRIHQLDTVTGMTESNGTVRGRAIQLAISLKQQGVVENDIVVISSRSHADETIVLLATLFIGGILAPIDMEATFNDWIAVIGKLKPKIAFCDIRAVSQMDRVLNKLGLQRDIIVFGGDACGDKPMFLTLFNNKEDAEFRPLSIDNPSSKIAFIVPTQGTTGPMKLVCLSHVNVMIRTYLLLEVMGRPQRLLSYYNLSFGIQCMAVCAAFENNITRILPGSFNERSCCKLIHDLNIDILLLSTNWTRKLCRNIAIKDFNMNCLKTVLVGGTYTAKEDMGHFRITLPKVQFIQVYSLQETGCVAAIPINDYKEAKKRPTSCGKVLQNQRVKIVDFETGDPVPIGTVGHIYVSGDSLMIGYYRKPKANTYMDKHFFMTQDIGKFDEQGWLYLEGRLDDIVTITIPGQTIVRFSCREIECVIQGHPFILEAIIVYFNEELVCCVRKRSNTVVTADRIKQFVEDRLPNAKRPRRYIFYEDFPRTAMGKVKRNVLKKDVFHTSLCVIESLADMRIAT